jgi:hypothetical protein
VEWLSTIDFTHDAEYGAACNDALYSQRSNNNAPFQVDLLKSGWPTFFGNRGRKKRLFEAHPDGVVDDGGSGFMSQMRLRRLRLSSVATELRTARFDCD